MTVSVPRPTTTEAWRKRVVKAQEAVQGDTTSPLVQVHLLEELAKGDPVSLERASELLGASKEEIDELFSAIDAAGGQLNDQGEFIGMALTLKPTRHSIRVNGNDMYAWCSLDTILLPGILETEGEIESTDPVTGETIRLTVNADQVVQVEPPTAVTSILVPGKTPTETDGDRPAVAADSEACTSMLFTPHARTRRKHWRTNPTSPSSPSKKLFDLARETWTEPTRALRRQAAAGSSDR